jgi:hypothetical protein
MTLFDCLMIMALFLSGMAYMQNKIAKIWQAICEIDDRKLDKEP